MLQAPEGREASKVPDCTQGYCVYLVCSLGKCKTGPSLNFSIHKQGWW